MCKFTFLTVVATFCYPLLTSAQDLSSWKEILSFRPSSKIQAEVQKRGSSWTVHRIEDASGRVNLDYYPIRVSRMPTLDGRELAPAEFLEHIRRNLNSFVDTSLTEFEPYQKADVAKWNSDDPDGAVLLIDIKLTRGISDLALVVTSKDASNEWRFSTVRGGSGYKALNNRDNPGAHPVSGNRAFGYFKQGEDWTFYTIGADRATRPMDEFWGIEDAREIGFKQADKLWTSFQAKLASFVKDHGGTARVDPKATKSKRYEWEEIRKDKTVFDTSNQPDWVPVPE